MSNTQASPLEIFLEYYRRRLKTATDAIEALPQTEENIHTHIRMTTKASCYRDFIYELQMVISTPPQEPSAKADEMERLKNKLADDFRKNYTLDLNAEGAAEEGFKAGWDKLLVLLQNQPSAKAIAEAAFNAGVDWRNGIITYGAVTNPFPDKEQYLSKFK